MGQTRRVVSDTIRADSGLVAGPESLDIQNLVRRFVQLTGIYPPVDPAEFHLDPLTLL